MRPHVSFRVNAERAEPMDYVVQVMRGAEELAGVVAEWDDLARHALEPNAYYEPWMVLPALRAFGSGKDLFFAFVYGPKAPERSGGRPLCGFFPLERHSKTKGLPVSRLELWKHKFCFLCTPLVREIGGEAALGAFLDWLPTAGAAVADWAHAPGDGPIFRFLTEHLARRGRPFLVENSYARALYNPPAGTRSEDYLNAALNGKRRSELRRQEKGLGRAGPIEWKTLERADDLPAWIDAFLALEASGWKGREETAFASKEPDRAFFSEMTGAAFASGRLMMLGLFQNGRPIALKCNFLAPPGSFAFKIAYDEGCAHCSPGVQLELENLRWLASQTECRWMDSCTAIPNHPMIDRLWTERRLMQDVLMSTGRRSGDWLLALLPTLRRCKRSLSRLRRPRTKPQMS
jgi:CelD/BcsL family acetyltransferase involved in cellulose biosynthesis